MKIQEKKDVIIPRHEDLYGDDDTYKSMYFVDTTVTLPEIVVPDTDKIILSSVNTEFKNSNKN